MEIFNTAPDFDSTVTSISSLPSPNQLSSTSIPTVQSQIIVQLADNRNSKQSVQQVQPIQPMQPLQQISQVPAPLVAPKPVFKRISSFNNNVLNEQDKGTNTPNLNISNEKQSKDRKSLGTTSGNHFRGSSLSRTSSLLQQQQQQQQNSDATNELTAILARQKKKIEAQTGDIDTNATHQHRSSMSQNGFKNNSNSIKLPSPNIAKKPPPPPRSDRSHSFTRKMSNEY